MKNQLTIFVYFMSLLTFGQTHNDWKKSAFTLTPEVLLGRTMKANKGFPTTKLQKQVVVSFGWQHKNNKQQWAEQWDFPKTGVSIGVTDFGNLDSLGLGFTAMPFVEFKAFKDDHWKVHSGLGASYFSKKHNAETNPNNRAVTTDLTWAFRLFLYYQFHSTQNIDWRTGIGYSHHSNGHTRLLNQGFNSFLISLSADINNPFQHSEIVDIPKISRPEQTVYDYFSFRLGLGQNVFAVAFNERKNVYTLAGEYGRVYNNTFKIGIGAYYRFYQNYFDYIVGSESLVLSGREFNYFTSNPWHYSTNFGVSVHGEIFLNHIGIDLQLGYSFHKPAYKLEWKINEGWENTPREIPENWVLGELNRDYKIKHRVSTRLGLKYYLIGLEKAPRNNIYIGAHLNANLSQADFSELSLGYTYRLLFRKRD